MEYLDTPDVSVKIFECFSRVYLLIRANSLQVGCS